MLYLSSSTFLLSSMVFFWLPGNEEGILIGAIEFWVVAPLSYFTPEMSLGAVSYCCKLESPTRSTCSALKRTLRCFIVSKLLVCKVLCYNLSCYTPENMESKNVCRGVCYSFSKNYFKVAAGSFPGCSHLISSAGTSQHQCENSPSFQTGSLRSAMTA